MGGCVLLNLNLDLEVKGINMDLGAIIGTSTISIENGQASMVSANISLTTACQLMLNVY